MLAQPNAEGPVALQSIHRITDHIRDGL
jgi:hypothetical protein